MCSRYIVRTDDGQDHYIHRLRDLIVFLWEHRGRMYYVRKNFF